MSPTLLTTLIVCMANCGAPTTTADEAGAAAAAYLQACHEMHVLKARRCPGVEVPVLLQCANDIERELPQKFRADFRNGQRVLAQKFAADVPAITENRFAAALAANTGDTILACQSVAAENAHRRLQLMLQLKSFGKGR
jgi:hypothetical protein